MEGDLTGGCVCRAVQYILHDRLRFRPYACHCRSCQTRTGSAFSEQLLFMRSDLVVEGAVDVGRYTQASGAISSIHTCIHCKVPLFSENSSRAGFAILRCGTLDRSDEVVPAAHVWTSSKHSWVLIPQNVPALAEQPRTTAEWMELIAPI